ncbi:small conductance mechanosensitive channel [Pedobacter cryoconitis]|uniref:Small conductance mechanosensitive channel n=1 Tax=Pedobacter cryoconitis TaxID=188932 RepID=A0A7W9DXE8_9SPHI|nr:mechanosensitive ion channel domain-containing protein [Pedobacter cryoconitis]MBB5634821.1 small conductance mechanosensitive channel [Pedobacter cryoconitis]MBB6272047.1 small conductance mechanosensitive channel [Pedobacter cryoconitis]
MNRIENYIEVFSEKIISGLPNFILAVITLLAGIWLIKWFMGFIHRRFKRNTVDISLSEFLISIIRVILYILLIISCASMIGIQTSSFVAVLGAGGLAVGLALQGSLSNFAGGVLILLFKPFKVGHVISSANNVSGTVLKIDILYTTLKAGNGTTIYAPNGPLANAVINNTTDNEIRQAEYKISISFDTNIDTARKVILAVLESDALILKDPKPAVLVSSLEDNAVILLARAWAANGDFWSVYYANFQKIKEALEKNQIILSKKADIYVMANHVS